VPIDGRLHRDEQSFRGDTNVEVDHLLNIFGSRRPDDYIESIIARKTRHPADATSHATRISRRFEHRTTGRWRSRYGRAVNR